MHVCIANKDICGTTGINTILDKTFQETRKNGLSEKKYDWCVMNKFFKVKKCTIIWNVDNLKMLHVDSAISLAFLLTLTHNMEILKITITRCKIHKYLSVTISYYLPGKAELSMIDYIGNVID